MSYHKEYGSGGCLGAVVAFTLSWITNHSLGWAIFHLFCSWIYVVYWVFKHL